jgi:hypothetical protein
MSASWFLWRTAALALARAGARLRSDDAAVLTVDFLQIG